MQVFTIHNRKGGSLKTTTTQNLGAVLALEKNKVLLIDCDGQGNLSSAFGFKDNASPGLPECLEAIMANKTPPFDTCIRNVEAFGGFLAILPTDESLFDAAESISNYKGNRGKVLSKLISRFDGNYDYVLIDTPPSAGWLVFNAILAANRILTPVILEAFSVEGIGGVSDSVIQLAESNDEQIRIDTLIPALFNAGRSEHKTYLGLLRQHFGHIVTETVLRQDSNVPKSQTQKVTIFQLDRNSKAAQDYFQLAKEITHGQ